MTKVFATEFDNDDKRIVMAPIIQADTIEEAVNTAEYYGLNIIGEITELLASERGTYLVPKDKRIHFLELRDPNSKEITKK